MSATIDDDLAGAPETERSIVARYTGGVAWPTVLLTAGLCVAAAASTTLAVTGAVPLVVGMLVNAVIAYAFYTVHHDATHKAISGRDPRWRRLDTVCGTIAAVALMLDFRGYSGVHLRHHAYTNQPDDPDHDVGGPLWQVPLKFAFAVTLTTIACLPYGSRLTGWIERKLGASQVPDERRERDNRRVLVWYRICLVAVLATIPFGWFWETVVLWWAAAQLGTLILVFAFQWLPHVPFGDGGRYTNTRITLFPGSTWLLLGQDHHLIHHLYPSIPWYRYRAAFGELRPLLEAKGARIQGRGTGRPIVMVGAINHVATDIS